MSKTEQQRQEVLPARRVWTLIAMFALWLVTLLWLTSERPVVNFMGAEGALECADLGNHGRLMVGNAIGGFDENRDALTRPYRNAGSQERYDLAGLEAQQRIFTACETMRLNQQTKVNIVIGVGAAAITVAAVMVFRPRRYAEVAA